uniref:Nuclear receptor domain-containing protein n=1 Tax=Onchocerca volvulus TaxID=6282 RepID=A0A8R1TRT3_ONCVO
MLDNNPGKTTILDLRNKEKLESLTKEKAGGNSCDIFRMHQMLKVESTVKDSDDIEKNNDLLCMVCGDQATGRHYGTIACNGCKGFFRRTIRRDYKYTCRFNSNCNIDKHNRAVCRSCRYMRCINAGMKIDAVQNERDVIGRRNRPSSSSSPSTSVTAAVAQSTTNGGFSTIKLEQTKTANRKQSSGNGQFIVTSTTSSLSSSSSLPRTTTSTLSSWDTPRSLLESLLSSEKKIGNLQETIMKQTDVQLWAKNQLYEENDAGRTATIKDIYTSIHSQLLLVIEWAKTLSPFTELSTDDQTALLKNYASQHIILGVSYRSKDNSNFLKLLNESFIPRCNDDNSDEYLENIYFRDSERIMDQLVAPMKFLKIDDVEFVALKACVLFNPVAKGLSSGSVMNILAARRRIFGALEHYVSTKIPTDVNRIGDLTFFILSPLQALANAICEDVLVFKLSGVANIDQLMEELILAETKERKISGRLNSETLSMKDLYEEKLKVSNLNHSTSCDDMESSMPNQLDNTSNIAPPGENIINDFVESSFREYSPTINSLSSFIMDPFKSNPSSPTQLEAINVSDINSSTYSSAWTTPSSHCTTYLESDDYFIASSMNL